MAEDRGYNSRQEFEGSTITCNKENDLHQRCEKDNDHYSSAITVSDVAIAIDEKPDHQLRRGENNREKSIVGVKTEVIILDEAPAAKIAVSSSVCDNRRVIELSDTMSKMELRRQCRLDVSRESSGCGGSRRILGLNDDDDDDDSDDDEDEKILSRLPPGTILIKQGASSAATTSRNCGREDSDYVHDSSKDSTESNSSGSSSATSYAAPGSSKARRTQHHRSARSKKIVEVRRNPARNKKKKPVDEDFQQRPRQRLLSVKRKQPGFVVDAVVARKRAKTAPVPYMNTRSVTRRMYTVGATYQAPTARDAFEWKDWPAHGMNERPVWHPQFGLAYSYNDRHFVSLDDRTYREIIDDSVIEVVKVDPHPERSLEIKYSGNSSNCDDFRQNCRRTSGSFETCMHGSFHSVLAYCARVVAPTYKSAVAAKFRSIADTEGKTVEATKPEVGKNSENMRKISGQSTQSMQESSKITAAASTSEMQKRLAPRRTISFTNVRNIQGNILQEVFGRASKNTLIFLKPTDPPAKPEKIVASSSSRLKGVEDSVEESNLDDAISDEALMEMSSMYNKLSPNEEIEAVSATAVKTVAEVVPQITAVVSKVSKKSPIAKERPLTDGARTSFSATGSRDSGGSNQASEIAKILAEYNEKAATNSGRKSEMRSGKLDKDCGKRTTFLSVVEQQPRKTYSRCSSQSKRESVDLCSVSEASKIDVAARIEEAAKNGDNDDGRAMDLTTAKSRKPLLMENEDETTNQKWLRELIEDTAVLYCAATGVRQDDVVNYLDTLDSAQSIEWLGSR